MRLRTVLIGIAAVGAASGILMWKLSSRPVQANAPQPEVPVTEGIAESKTIPVYVKGLGTVQAYNIVNVRTQVSGQITKVFFQEGQEVKAGDPLFQIDPRPFQAALNQAQANKAKDEAQLRGAQLDLERYSKLLAPGFQSRQSFDQQTATVGQLQGTVQADQAQIDNAQLNLDYALIRSPIDGRTGQRLVDLGNYVQAGQASLVSVAQLKPIFVSLTVPQESLDRIRQREKKATLTVQAFASDDKTLLSVGQVTLIDNQIDTATGTIHLRATFQNNDERLWPGEFVSARLVLGEYPDAVTVPAQTVMQGPEGAFAYIITPNQTAERRKVDVALTQDGIAIIDKGISVGEHVVVEGQYRVTNGAKLKIDNAQPAAVAEQQPTQ
ncbi:MAG: efflux RND transporter periplasmic adaptor subunit [Bradyrhizobiaceae bacterium]|nr:efflux RND transporter periplasmic adaptor subunit [Bradyrhizobiaceae bacterium]